MNVTETSLPGVLVFDPKIHGDERGFFMESWHSARYAEHGVPATFLQDNLSYSQGGVLRGLHCQHPYGQGKLVTVIEGEVYDVAVDVQPDSPSFGEWVSVTLDGKSKRQIYIPPGFAHGFYVTSPTALFMYKCTEVYKPEHEFSVLWNDPDIGIEWPSKEPRLSDKDRGARRLREIPTDRLPTFRGHAT